MAEIGDEPERPKPRLSAPVPLAAEHDLSAFDCGEPALNEWLRHRALKNESRFSRTYVVCEGKRVIAYFWISAGAVVRAAAPGRIRRNAPDTIPVSVIGRLAVSREHGGKGLGADILSDALRRIAAAAKHRHWGGARPRQRRCGQALLYDVRRVHRISGKQPNPVSSH
jgi:hypothetical protein